MQVISYSILNGKLLILDLDHTQTSKCSITNYLYAGMIVSLSFFLSPTIPVLSNSIILEFVFFLVIAMYLSAISFFDDVRLFQEK
jgi:hypothetical protein